uniref:Stress-associated endoplasmic reticulum protein n=1 Tax=Blastobotrys adeninivorans TaxID=409370 RepID=A0A060TB51_BLAAD
MPQTPRQRLANERYAKKEQWKKGKPTSEVKPKQKDPLPISKGWLALLAFLVLGGGIFELLRLFGIY